ncbi:flagellar protein YvyF [Halobacillus yeomjeoni]|uniref:TIGR03826 family flagellar region protein n=1 Tax=Halobacillus yeomjeoni TaxID=311194 RepID=UPI001CD1974B|nr:TIGR03826 family flagellar region protein [Halobacillus yeomjeoni]MCA0984682.1 flagellar protein YvyF [Halobacillus yeomjeoni]
MGEVANCPHCNAIFFRGPATMCKDCMKKEEEQFQAVYAFMRIRKNRTAQISQIVEGTGVPEKQIRKFVKQKRLHPAQFPSLSYECEKCGGPIQDGRICLDCIKEIESGLKQVERDKELSEMKKQAAKMTYYSVKDD